MKTRIQFVWLCARAASYSFGVFCFFALSLGAIILPQESHRIWGRWQSSFVGGSIRDNGRTAIVVVRQRNLYGNMGFRTHLALADLTDASSALTPRWPMLKPRCVAALPGQTRALVGTTLGEIYEVDLQRAQPALIGRQRLAPAELACASDGQTALALDKEYLSAWDLNTKSLRWQLSGGQVRAFALSPDPAVALAALGEQGEIAEVCLQTGRTLRTVYCHGASVLRLAVCPLGKRVASVSGSSELLVADLATGDILWRRPASEIALPAVAFSTDGQQIAAIVGESCGWAIAMWEAHSGNLVDTFGQQPSIIHGLTFSRPDRLTLWGANGTVQSWSHEASLGKWQLWGEIGTESPRTESPRSESAGIFR